MTMAVVQITQCDLCKQMAAVPLTVKYGDKSFQLDVCQSCFDERLGDMARKGHKPRGKAPAYADQKYRIRKTEITEANLR